MLSNAFYANFQVFQQDFLAWQGWELQSAVARANELLLSLGREGQLRAASQVFLVRLSGLEGI